MADANYNYPGGVQAPPPYTANAYTAGAPKTEAAAGGYGYGFGQGAQGAPYGGGAAADASGDTGLIFTETSIRVPTVYLVDCIL